MIRIRTSIGLTRVSTFLFENKWTTIYHIAGRASFLEGYSFQEAGQNHLNACKMVNQSQKVVSVSS